MDGNSYPYITRDELLGQLSSKRQQFNSYEKYANATLKDIFNETELQRANKLTITHQETTVLMSTANGKYQNIPLPIQAQYAPVSEIITSDFNHDGKIDLLLLGNNDYYKLRIGKFDANYGTVLLGYGDGTFKYVSQPKSGLSLKGSNTHALMINDELILTSYGASTETYKLLK